MTPSAPAGDPAAAGSSASATPARWATGRALTGSAVATAILLLLANLPLLPVSAPVIAERSGGVRILDIAPQPDPAAVYAAVDRYDRTRYLWEILTLDLVLPAAYGFALAAALLLLLRRLAPGGARLRWLAALPVGAALLDYAENASIAALLVAHPDRLDPLARAQIALTSVKNAVLAASLAALAITFAAWAIRAARR